MLPLIPHYLQFALVGLALWSRHCLVAGQCAAVNLQLYQKQDGAFVDLGSAGPIATGQTLQEFYNYRHGSYGGTDLPLAGKTSLVAIHQNTNSCQLGFVLVHSKPYEGDAFGSAFMYVNGELWDPLVKDDPSFTDIVLHDDSYDPLYRRRLGYTLVQHSWFWYDTDGLAQPIVENWTGCILVDPDFSNTENGIVPGGGSGPSFNGMQDTWKFVSHSGDTTDLTMDQGDELAICFGGATPSKPRTRSVSSHHHCR